MSIASFTALEHILIEKTEEAVRDGLQLERWCRANLAALPLIPLDLKKEYKLKNRPAGYFGQVEINGKTRSVMGALQEIEFGRLEGGDALERLRHFVLAEFLKRAHWTYPDGHPGGFSTVKWLYRTAAGEYGKFEEQEAAGAADWRRIGPEYTWVMQTVQIHDFVMNFGPFTKRFKEAACVAPALSFMHDEAAPAPGIAARITIGYPFVEYAPIPNSFGFGPGKFGTAIKQYIWELHDSGAIIVKMNFAAAPRCRKVFDFGAGVPDPVYGGAELLRRITFGLFDPQPFHDKLDTQMLAQHCRVHQALIEGVHGVWEAWLREPRADSANR